MNNAPIDASLLGSALADAIDRVGPAVVHITVQDRVASGVVWSASEHLVVTTSRLFHDREGVAREATVTVVTGAGAARSGTLVGVDETTELALVRVQALDDQPLSDVPWADGARPGLFVAPVARTSSGVRTTFGLVTRVGPAWVTARGGTVDAYIDVDGSLPPGFSGGPLIDFAGRVLGVNTRGLVPGGATLPTATVRRVVGLLAAGSGTAPGHLGVGIQAVELPDHLRADPTIAAGLLVTAVVPGSAAEAAGILVADTLVAIDGQPVPDHAHLLAALAGKVGTVVSVQLARHGQSIAVEVTPQPRAERRRGRPHGHQGGHHHGGPGALGAAIRGWWGKGCR